MDVRAAMSTVVAQGVDSRGFAPKLGSLLSPRRELLRYDEGAAEWREEVRLDMFTPTKHGMA